MVIFIVTYLIILTDLSQTVKNHVTRGGNPPFYDSQLPPPNFFPYSGTFGSYNSTTPPVFGDVAADGATNLPAGMGVARIVDYKVARQVPANFSRNLPIANADTYSLPTDYDNRTSADVIWFVPPTSTTSPNP